MLPYVKQLRAEHVAERAELESALPFNPKSPKQVKEYFEARDIKLIDTQEETVRELIEDLGGEDLAPEELESAARRLASVPCASSTFHGTKLKIFGQLEG